MTAYLGIDVGKDTLVVALLGPATPRKTRVPNTPAGHQQLLTWLGKQRVDDVHACLEATGTYGDDIALTLYEAGLRVSVVNPARTAAYAKTHLRRQKTDPADARLLAEFCQQQQPALWSPPDPALRELRALVRHLDDLQTQRQAEENRLTSGRHPAFVQEAMQAHLAFLDTQIQAVEQQIQQHSDHHPGLREQIRLLTSIPGVGERTATRVLAEAGDVRQFTNARALAAYAGVTPKLHQSGRSVEWRSRMSKVGNATLRAALYMPAAVAKRHNPIVREFCARLEARGLSKMAVIGAAMHKLLHLMYGVLKHGKPFDPQYGRQQPTGA